MFSRYQHLQSIFADSVLPFYVVKVIQHQREKSFLLNLDVIRKQVEDKRLRHEEMTGTRKDVRVIIVRV